MPSASVMYTAAGNASSTSRNVRVVILLRSLTVGTPAGSATLVTAHPVHLPCSDHANRPSPAKVPSRFPISEGLLRASQRAVCRRARWFARREPPPERRLGGMRAPSLEKNQELAAVVDLAASPTRVRLALSRPEKIRGYARL